jgi:hypothetical protein
VSDRLAEDPEDVVFNGLNGSTGEYLWPPTTRRSLAAGLRGGATHHADELDELRYRDAEPAFGVVFGVDDLDDLASTGWALVAAQDTPPDVLETLAPLRELRAEQAGERYREFIGPDGLAPGEDKRAFLARNGIGPGMPVNPVRLPYYLLLIGGPEQIGFTFQYQLDVEYAVGRLSFDHERLERYVSAVVAAEATDRPSTRRSRFFGPAAEDDRATILSATELVAPLGAALQHDVREWDIDVLPPGACTKDRLLQLVSDDDAPALLFTASHGLGFDADDERQRDEQGALVCQDWSGPADNGQEPIPPDCFVAGSDVEALDAVNTELVMTFACFGAGTPHRDEFSRPGDGAAAQELTQVPFVSKLAEQLLTHAHSSTLAFVGHVERAWGYSFLAPGVGSQTDVFASCLQALMAGWRVGHAMEFFDDRYSSLSTALHDMLHEARTEGLRLDDVETARMWTAVNDARSYVVIGDPAVRLRT